MTVAPVETLAAAAFDASRPFVSSMGEHDLVYFLLNVGDGDTQLILLPESPTGRRAIVVDCATSTKLPALAESLGKSAKILKKELRSDDEPKGGTGDRSETGSDSTTDQR